MQPIIRFASDFVKNANCSDKAARLRCEEAVGPPSSCLVPASGERADFESVWLGCPGFEDEFVWTEGSEGFEASGEVIGGDEVAQVRSQLVVGFLEVSFDGGVLDGVVHSFDLPVIRYEIRLCARLFPKGRRVMVSPSGTRGAGSTKVRAGRR